MGGVSVSVPLVTLLVSLLLPEAGGQGLLLRLPFLRPFSLSSLGGRERERRPDMPVIVRASRVNKVDMGTHSWT